MGSRTWKNLGVVKVVRVKQTSRLHVFGRVLCKLVYNIAVIGSGLSEYIAHEAMHL